MVQGKKSRIRRSQNLPLIDHVSIQVSDLDRSSLFYEAVLQPLEMTKLVERRGTIGFGKKYPEFWLNHRPHGEAAAANTGAHICLRASSAEVVREFHATALASGGSSDGAPGDRDAAMTKYFGAFIIDLDGNRVEVVTFPR
jgi:catechol 2,3-dioxygenase-like lactoylglutathione lyase family enzyme